MKNNRIITAWDNVNPSPEAKERMLQNILASQSTAASRKKSPPLKYRRALILAGSFCVLCLLCFPFLKYWSSGDTSTGTAYGPGSSLESFQEAGACEAEETIEEVFDPDPDAGAWKGESEPLPGREAQEGEGLLSGKPEEILLSRSKGLTAYFRDTLEPQENADAWKALSYNKTEGCSSCSESPKISYSDSTAIIRGTVTSLKSFEIRREDGSLFPSFGTVTTILVSHPIRGDTEAGDAITVVLPHAAYQQLDTGRTFTAPNPLLSALLEGREGIFLLDSAALQKEETENTTLYWQDLGEYVLYSPESLFLQGETELLYSEEQFPELSPEASLGEVEQFLKVSP